MMNLDGIKLIFADLDDTLTELYKPATKATQQYLNELLARDVVLCIITGQGKENIYDRVVSFIKNEYRRNILMCGCSGAYIYGFDEYGQINDEPFYSIYDEKLDVLQKKKFREITQQLVDEFNLTTYPKMPREEFRAISAGRSTSIILDDRISQITFEVINDLALREKIYHRGNELLKENKMPVRAVKAGTYAIDFAVEGASKTTAVKYIMKHVLKQMGRDCPNNDEIQVWGDKFSLINGGTDMNMLYGLNKDILAIDFRDEPDEELDLTYNIQKWQGKDSLSKGLEEYLKTALSQTK